MGLMTAPATPAPLTALEWVGVILLLVGIMLIIDVLLRRR